MKKIWILVVLVLVAVFGSRVWYLSKNKTDETNVVKIGLILPLSGMPAKDGKEALEAAKIAEREINTSQNKFKLKLVSEDGKFTAKDSISAFSKIQGTGVVATLIYGDMPTLSIIPLIEKSPFPILTISGSRNITTSSPWTYRMFLPAFERSNAVISFLKENKKVKTVSVLYVKEPIGEEVIASFQNQLKETNIKILDMETFRPTDLNTEAQILKLLDKNPDALFVFGWNPGYVNALNYLKDLRYNGLIITDLNIAPNIDLLHQKGAGIYYADLDPQENGFRVKFKEKYRYYPNPHTIFTYESIRLLANIIQNVGPNPKLIKQNLDNLEVFESDFGNISFDNDGEIKNLKVVIKQLQPDGTAKIIKE